MNSIGKRPFEEITDREVPPAKKQKLEPSSQIVPVPLNKEMMSWIARFLPVTDLIKFSAVAKKVEGWTEEIFKEKREQERLGFSWSCCEEEASPQRASYVLGKALSVYVQRREELIKNPSSLPIAPRPSQAQVVTLYKSFQGVMKRFPSLGNYIWKDLNHLAPTPLQSIDAEVFLKTSLFPLAGHATSSDPFGGDELLKGLFHLTNYCHHLWTGNQRPVPCLHSALPHLQGSIEAKATCASDLGIRILAPVSHLTDEYGLNLAILSAAHQDYRGIHCLLSKNKLNPQLAYQDGLYYPPILVEMGLIKLKASQYLEAENLFEQGIKNYGNPLFIPAMTWACAGINKSILKRWKKAEEYLERALNNIPPSFQASGELFRIWGALHAAKIGLEKWEEAEKCNEQLMALYAVTHERIFPTSWMEMAWTQANLRKWEKANLYFDKAIDEANRNPTPAQELSILWETAAAIKALAEQWEQAEEFIDKAMLFAENPPAHVLARLALIKARLKKWPEAKTAIECALYSYGSPPLWVKELAAEINAQFCLLNQQTG